MSDKPKSDTPARIGEILDVMRNTWDLPADCNEGELFAYAETLYDRIASGDGKDALYAYLAGVQVDNLEMPPTLSRRSSTERSPWLRFGADQARARRGARSLAMGARLWQEPRRSFSRIRASSDAAVAQW